MGVVLAVRPHAKGSWDTCPPLSRLVLPTSACQHREFAAAQVPMAMDL